MPEYVIPSDLEQALSLLGTSHWKIIAGGTDFYPAQGDKPVTDSVLDLSNVSELAGISEQSDHWRIGALATWTSIAKAEFPPAFTVLQQAALEVGALQIQNAGTIAGNLCNASPAADGVPPLLVLQAEVELSSAAGSRRLPVAEFITGVRETELRVDELVSAILIPRASHQARSRFIKLGSRSYLAISIAMVAVFLERQGGEVANARIAVGSCSPVAQRLPTLEQALSAQPWQAELAQLVSRKHLAPLSPIDDIRATAEYRLVAVTEILQRAIRDCVII